MNNLHSIKKMLTLSLISFCLQTNAQIKTISSTISVQQAIQLNGEKNVETLKVYKHENEDNSGILKEEDLILEAIFDDNGNIVEGQCFKLMNNGMLSSSEKITYCEGKLEKKERRQIGKKDRMEQMKIEYFENNKLIKVETYDLKNKLIDVVKYEYLGKEEKKIFMLKNGEKGYTQKKIYDDRQNQIMFGEEIGGKDRGYSKWIEYNYNEDGTIQEQRSVDKDGNILNKQVVKYDEKKNLIESKVYYKSDGDTELRIDKSATFSYNSYGDLTSWTSETSRTIFIINFHYDYDEHGNWIRRTMDSSLTKGFALTRIIKYKK